MIGWVMDQAVDWVLGSVQDTLNLVWALLVSTLFHLPDVTALAPVAHLSARSLLVVNIGYGLVIAAVGVVLMMGSGLPIQYGLGDLLPRLAIGLVAANVTTGICTTIITSANALVVALTSQGIASPDALGQVLSVTITALTNPVAALLTAVIGLIVTVLVVLLMVGWITRFVTLILLCGIAPLALAGHGTPWTDEAARLWWRSMAGVCLTVILQALALNTSLSIFFTPGTDLSRYGLPADPSGLLPLFIVAVLLGITVRIPALVRQYVTQARGRQNVVGTLVRLVIAQQLTRGLAQGVRTATASALNGRHSQGSHGGLGRHVSGGARGRAGAPQPGTSGFYPRPGRGRSGSPAGSGQRAGEGGAGVGRQPWPGGTGAHSNIGRHTVGQRRMRGGFDDWPIRR